ncbi:peptide methionine sulfoxide reductase MsrA-like isoform X1 [Opisthocomus hoazin]|uniref:peptide methionine sulfoxide reductase MsrA-like isoform X1 n=2 Tax=Opisthocomus hoazin TaxID=30419 RepID=UPI003F530B27
MGGMAEEQEGTATGSVTAFAEGHRAETAAAGDELGVLTLCPPPSHPCRQREPHAPTLPSRDADGDFRGQPLPPPAGMGCFWGAERLFWETPGVFSTQVGYAGGFTPNPTYEEVRTGLTGHAEVVRVIFDAQKLSYEELLKVFWENHDPTQGMQQQEDLGTQYRSVIYTLGPQQQAAALRSREMYQRELRERQRGDITTAIEPAGDFYYAEERHQQYLHKVPGGSCAPKGTGVTCPIAP